VFYITFCIYIIYIDLELVLPVKFSVIAYSLQQLLIGWGSCCDINRRQSLRNAYIHWRRSLLHCVRLRYLMHTRIWYVCDFVSEVFAVVLNCCWPWRWFSRHTVGHIGPHSDAFSDVNCHLCFQPGIVFKHPGNTKKPIQTHKVFWVLPGCLPKQLVVFW